MADDTTTATTGTDSTDTSETSSTDNSGTGTGSTDTGSTDTGSTSSGTDSTDTTSDVVPAAVSVLQRQLTIPAQWALNANTIIPAPPIPGQSYRKAALTATEMLTGQGYSMIADSAQWNALHYLITSMLLAAENYGILPWSSLTDYPAGAFTLGLDGRLYNALQASGPGNGGAVNPSTESPRVKWGDYIKTVLSEVPVAGAATETANGTPAGIVTLAADNASASARNLAATPASVANQVQIGIAGAGTGQGRWPWLFETSNGQGMQTYYSRSGGSLGGGNLDGIKGMVSLEVNWGMQIGVDRNMWTRVGMYWRNASSGGWSGPVYLSYECRRSGWRFGSGIQDSSMPITCLPIHFDFPNRLTGNWEINLFAEIYAHSEPVASKIPLVSLAVSFLEGVVYSSPPPPPSPVTITTTQAQIPALTLGLGTSLLLKASGGKSPYTWTANGLPPGLNMGSGGSLGGTCTQTGTFTSNFVVISADGQSASAFFTFTVNMYPALALTTTSIPNGTVGEYFDFTLTASGGLGEPYTFEVTGLPAGVFFDRGSRIIGSPTTAGTVPLAIKVSQEINGQTVFVSKTLPWTVAPAAASGGIAPVEVCYKAVLNRLKQAYDSATIRADSTNATAIQTEYSAQLTAMQTNIGYATNPPSTRAAVVWPCSTRCPECGSKMAAQTIDNVNYMVCPTCGWTELADYTNNADTAGSGVMYDSVPPWIITDSSGGDDEVIEKGVAPPFILVPTNTPPPE